MTTQLSFLGLSVLLMILALPALFFPSNFKKAVSNFMSKNEYLYLLAFILLIISWILFTVSWKVSLTLKGFVAFMAWVVLFKAIFTLYFPKALKLVMEYFISNKVGVFFIGITWTIFSMVFFYLALLV